MLNVINLYTHHSFFERIERSIIEVQLLIFFYFPINDYYIDRLGIQDPKIGSTVTHLRPVKINIATSFISWKPITQYQVINILFCVPANLKDTIRFSIYFKAMADKSNVSSNEKANAQIFCCKESQTSSCDDRRTNFKR